MISGFKTDSFKVGDVVRICWDHPAAADLAARIPDVDYTVSRASNASDGTPVYELSGGYLVDGAVIEHTAKDCQCYMDCRDDSYTGRWHQHSEEPCPVHPQQVTA